MEKTQLSRRKFVGADHITHHRGQIVVYLRLNGIKPPQYRSGFFG
jgi:uncharacterized damage-inducible protein DinB